MLRVRALILWVPSQLGFQAFFGSTLTLFSLVPIPSLISHSHFTLAWIVGAWRRLWKFMHWKKKGGEREKKKKRLWCCHRSESWYCFVFKFVLSMNACQKSSVITPSKQVWSLNVNSCGENVKGPNNNVVALTWLCSTLAISSQYHGWEAGLTPWCLKHYFLRWRMGCCRGAN